MTWTSTNYILFYWLQQNVCFCFFVFLHKSPLDYSERASEREGERVEREPGREGGREGGREREREQVEISNPVTPEHRRSNPSNASVVSIIFQSGICIFGSFRAKFPMRNWILLDFVRYWCYKASLHAHPISISFVSSRGDGKDRVPA